MRENNQICISQLFLYNILQFIVKYITQLCEFFLNRFVFYI